MLRFATSGWVARDQVVSFKWCHIDADPAYRPIGELDQNSGAAPHWSASVTPSRQGSVVGVPGSGGL